MVKEIIKYGSVVLIACGLCFFMTKRYSNRIAYIDITKVYGEFKLTRELDAKLKATNEHRKTILDSLGFSIKMLETRLGLDPKNQEQLKIYQLQRQEYFTKDEQYAKDYEAQSQEYNTQILKQINEYTEKYRITKGIDVLIGANGSGFMMAADTKLDMTPDFISYINSSYSGK